jgi:hypothetical protein
MRDQTGLCEGPEGTDNWELSAIQQRCGANATPLLSGHSVAKMSHPVAWALNCMLERLALNSLLERLALKNWVSHTMKSNT